MREQQKRMEHAAFNISKIAQIHQNLELKVFLWLLWMQGYIIGKLDTSQTYRRAFVCNALKTDQSI